jgi:ubiquinone/menaquinone biosynthesis C-methylase UbiE
MKKNLYLLCIAFSFNLQLFTHSIELNAPLYDARSLHQKNSAQALIEKMSLKGNELGLDIGCGSGANTKLIGDKLTSGYILGIDNSPSMIRFSKETYSSSTCHFVLKDFEMLDEENHYDFITVFSSLYCFSDPKLAYQKIIRALKPGGKAYFITYPKEDPIWNTCQQALEMNVQWSKYQDKSAFKRILSVQDHKDYLESLSIKILEFEDVKSFSKHSNRGEFKEYLASWASLFISLPLSEMEDYIDSITQISEPLFQENNGEICVPLRYLSIIIERPD